MITKAEEKIETIYVYEAKQRKYRFLLDLDNNILLNVENELFNLDTGKKFIEGEDYTFDTEVYPISLNIRYSKIDPYSYN